MSRPDPLAAVLMIVLAWVTNLIAPALKLRSFDAPPFNVLELVATAGALFTTLMILATQRREKAAK